MTTSTTALVTGVDFITVPTRDFERAGEFYATVLGLRPSARWGSMPAGEFETGTLTIAVMQSDAFGIEFQPHTHPIALHVDDVAAARAELESRGVSFRADTIDSGVCHMAHFADPDGNGLMLHHRYAPRPAAGASGD
jgi:predicted enzyme related to lactoylglutathione lyase